MSASQPVVRDISDTALWAAYFRARETRRQDALFHDPYAERLCGERGEDIARTIPDGTRNAWAWVARTYLFDRFLAQELSAGVDMVVNLAAGLDARPYRMTLPAALQWVEVDLPEILDYKERILAGEKPACAVERVRLDLSNVPGRRDLLAALNARAKRILVITEGLLIYLAPEEVAALARDLAAGDRFQRWVVDIASPGLLRLMDRTAGKHLSEIGVPFKFGPEEGPSFFSPHGWSPLEVESLLSTAARFKRPPFFLRIVAKFPEPKGRQGRRPWSGVCLLGRTS